MLERGATNVHGADIDSVNIDWCNDVLGWKNAVRVGFDPPMPWADGFFDVVYGHSVFTHLSLKDQQAWIAELHRITQIGGFVFTTIASEGGVYLTRWNQMPNKASWIEQFFRDGFTDFQARNVGVDAGRKGYSPTRRKQHGEDHARLVTLFHGAPDPALFLR